MYQFTPDPTEVTGRRIGAWILDFVFAGVLATIAFAAVVDVHQTGRGNPCFDAAVPDQEQVPACRGELGGTSGWFIYDESSDESVFFAGPFWVPGVVFVGYGLVSFVIVEGAAGGSLGKLIVGLRVVTAEGRRAGVGRSAIRFLCWAVDGFPWCLPLVGLIVGTTTKGHRRVGDMAAQTFVVTAAHVGHAVTVPGLNAPAAAAYAMPVHPGAPYPGPAYPPAAPGAPWGTPTGPSPWAPPAGAGPWAPPGTAVPWSDPPAATEATGSHPTEPQWDEDRDTYIQWDVHRNRWLQWDVEANQWRSIE